MRTVCRYRFHKGDRETIEEQMATAIVVAEIIYGKARVRLSASYYFTDNGKHGVVDVSDEVGEEVARVFTGLLIRKLGEESFEVERILRRSGQPA